MWSRVESDFAAKTKHLRFSKLLEILQILLIRNFFTEIPVNTHH